MSLFDDADLVFSYGRRQALKDGVLVNVTGTAWEAGFRYPVAVTRTVWAQIIEPDEASRAVGQSPEGRLWDVLWMRKLEIALKRAHISTTFFEVIVVLQGKSKTITLKAVCGPADDWSPCLTIMFPHED